MSAPMTLAAIIEALRTAPQEAGAVPGTVNVRLDAGVVARAIGALEAVDHERADLYQRLAIKRIAEMP